MQLNAIDWKNISYDDFITVINTEQNSFKFARNVGLLDNEILCECGRIMLERKKSDRKYGRYFVCSGGKNVCLKNRSILHGSFFKNSKLSITQGFKAIAGYAMELTNNQLGFLIGIKSGNTMIDWNNHFRVICRTDILSDDRTMIGGDNCTVEIDETYIFKRKYNVGRLSQNQQSGTWVFGGLCRETGDVFVCPVKTRNRDTLFTIIREKIAPGTRIISDCWRAYNTLNEEGFIHSQINHRYNFISPSDPTINTQRIERS
jgi:transposase-like protein